MSSYKKEGDGKTADTAPRLDEFNLPKFMLVGAGYQVVIGPIFLRGVSLFCREVYKYTVRGIGGDGQVFFIETPVKLPRRFLVTKMVPWVRWYLYRPISVEGKKAKSGYSFSRSLVHGQLRWS